MSDKYAALKQAAEKAKLESKDEWGYDTDAFHDESTPETILELLAERDADRARIAELEQQLISPLPIGELIQRLSDQTGEDWSAKYCAEPEARTLFVKLPHWSGYTCSGEGAMLDACVRSLESQGITVQIEGE